MPRMSVMAMWLWQLMSPGAKLACHILFKVIRRLRPLRADVVDLRSIDAEAGAAQLSYPSSLRSRISAPFKSVLTKSLLSAFYLIVQSNTHVPRLQRAKE